MKTLKVLTLGLVLLLITACGSKVPFNKNKEPLANAALVYVYAPESVTSDEDPDVYSYSIRINNKRYLERVTEGEYLAFDLKPLTIDLSATRDQVEEHKLKVRLKAGHIYYFRILKGDDNTFTFERVDANKALKEIVKTGLAGSEVEDDDNIINEFVHPKDDKDSVMVKQTKPIEQPKTAAPMRVAPVAVPVAPAPKRATASKLDEIKEAYQMKKDGAISDEEFKTIKAQILAK